nr:hypothetical protein [Tanacetum cinerariifolium]
MYETRQTTIPFPCRLNGYYCEEKNGSYRPQFSKAYSEASHIDYSIPRKEKDLRSFTLPCFINNVCSDNTLADLGASVSLMPISTYLNLGLGKFSHTKLTVELADKTMKYPKGIAENVLVGIGKFVFPLDFIILDMPEDIKVPLILERLFLPIARAKIDVYKRKITLRVGDERIIFTSIKLASNQLDPFLEDYIELNDLNVPLDLRRNQDFAVLEDMDAYRDKGMRDVIFGELFLREVGIKARRFDGMITIYNGPRERNIDEYWWRIYKSGDLKALES